MSSFHKNTPDEWDIQMQDFGPTLTIQSSMSFSRSPTDVFRYLGKLRTIVRALPELRILRLVDGDTYFWKLELGGDLSLEGELRFTQRREGDFVMWQTTESSPTQLTGSIRFHAVDEPIESAEDELSSTHLVITLHCRVPVGLMARVGGDEVRRRLARAIDEGLLRIRGRLEEPAAPSFGLRTESASGTGAPRETGKKDSPLR